MRALSIRQPWAWLIVNGHKDIENRSWETKYRGRIAIHAGKRIEIDTYLDLPRIVRPTPEPPPPATIETGGIVGFATIIDCVTESESPWFFGRYGFVLEDQRSCELIPMPGQLGFFFAQGVEEPTL